MVSATNTLTNRGRITSAGNLTATAGTLDNYATLGGATALRINADTLRNDRGLIFSGNDMTLRVGTFTNTYADLYSLGELSIARNDRGTRATHVENISGSLESAGNMSLLADSLINRKDKLTVRTERVSGASTPMPTTIARARAASSSSPPSRSPTMSSTRTARRHRSPQVAA